jgi:hypothetical protein
MTLDELRYYVAEIITSKWEYKNLSTALLKRLEEEGVTCEPKEEPEDTRTEQQHKSLFAWFGMIEKEAENQGITFDMVVKHTHQLRITKEALHVLCKALQKALWGTESTKELKKREQLDIIIDHFTDLFGKVGLELPPFPDRERQEQDAFYEKAPRKLYPEGIDEYTGPPTI